MPESCVHAPLPYESIAFLALTHLPLPPSLSDFATHSSVYLTLAAWMSFWVFILYIPFLLWAGHCLGMGFPFFDLAHVSFYPMSVGWLVLLPSHCIAPSTISLIFLSSRLIGGRVCHFNSLYYFFFWSLLPSIPIGPTHLVPWASSVHFIIWACQFHPFLPLSIVFAKSFGLSWPNYHVFTFGFIGLQANIIY